MDTPRRILLTGSNGLLGQKLLEKLHNRQNVELIATGRGSNRCPIPEGYAYREVDLTQFVQLERLMREVRPTDVINCAAMTNVDQCEREPQVCEQVNVDAVRHLCGLCKETGARLLHLSTDFVFDGQGGPYAEDAAPNPLSVYGRAKLAAEDILVRSGTPHAIIRTVLVYGVVPDMSRSNIVLWAKQSLEAGKDIHVVDDQYRSPTLAEDLADGVLAVLFRNKTGLFHISGADVFSVYDIAQEVAKFWGLDASLIHRTDSASLNQAAARPPRTGFIILKAQTELGYQPHSLQAGLRVVDQQLDAYQAQA